MDCSAKHSAWIGNNRDWERKTQQNVNEGTDRSFRGIWFPGFKKIFTVSEVSLIRREAEEFYVEDRGTISLINETQYVDHFFERKPFLSTLVDDDRIYQLGVDLLGPDFILSQTEGRLRTGNTLWHGPIADKHEPRGIKIKF